MLRSAHGSIHDRRSSASPSHVGPPIPSPPRPPSYLSPWSRQRGPPQGHGSDVGGRSECRPFLRTPDPRRCPTPCLPGEIDDTAQDDQQLRPRPMLARSSAKDGPSALLLTINPGQPPIASRQYLDNRAAAGQTEDHRVLGLSMGGLWHVRCGSSGWRCRMFAPSGACDCRG